MFGRFFAGVAALAICTLAAPGAEAKFWQCVPFARATSGVDLHGNALTWWNQAAGKYARGATPRKGAVMSFAATGHMPLGHVATVSQVVNDREVLLTHANWSRRGGVETDVRAVDVSAAGDWSRVRVWFASVGDLGRSTYPINGFIYADNVDRDDAEMAQVLIASASPVAVAPVRVDPIIRAAAFTLDLE